MKITIEITRPSWLHAPRSRRGMTALLVAIVTLAMPAAALADHGFSDVPRTAFYHDAASALAGAGITLGCGGTNFCPDVAVTRGQMAAFMHRSLPRVAYGSELEVVSQLFETVDISVLTIKAGEATGGTVFVKVDGSATSYIQAMTGCPCRAVSWISRDGSADQSLYINNNVSTMVSGIGIESGSVSYVFAVPSGSTETFRLKIRVVNGDGMKAYGQLSAIYTPFGSQGASAP